MDEPPLCRDEHINYKRLFLGWDGADEKPLGAKVLPSSHKYSEGCLSNFLY